MPNYVAYFVCTRNGARTDGRMPISLDLAIPSLDAARQLMTGDVTDAVAKSTGDRITDLTITDIRLG